MTKLKNKNILITGGASGIGKIMSRISLERKAKVIIWDINTENIGITLKDLSPLGDIFANAVDISNLQEIETTAQKHWKGIIRFVHFPIWISLGIMVEHIKEILL